MNRWRCWSLCVALFTASLAWAAQQAPSLKISGDIPKPTTLTAADLAKMPRATVQTSNDGLTVSYEGVWLYEVLKQAGAPLGGDLRGKALTTYVLARAQDGYEVVFSLGELDPGTVDSPVLLADTSDGTPLFGEQGAFRLVIPKDKRGARSVRMLSELTIVQIRK